MSFQLNMPPSMTARLTKEEEEAKAQEGGSRREDYKKLKELEEARKAGTAPAMQDERGMDINPHIPQYIMQAPWYYGTTAPTLSHQRQQEDKIKKYDDMSKWYKRGIKQGPIATKFRKGACENCGAITHKKKDCLEKPRKLGAKYTGTGIAPDEQLQTDISLDYEGKRDRWNGYDINLHKKIIEDYAKTEEAKRQLKAQRLETDVLETEDAKDVDKDQDSDDDDEDKYAEEMAMPGQKFETKQRITVRNLRIREDTAKYLYNLDVNSAHYDPKTRSMRDNPFKNPDKALNNYTGDNFVRTSGDAMEFARRQMFAWEAYEKGTEVHLQADPTKLDMLNREYKKRKADFKTEAKNTILDKYGGEEHLDAPAKELLLAQTENYVEYSRHGTIIKGQEKVKVLSRYEEDVYINNHTSVWGSYWSEGEWGYKCCHSTVQGSYCTGKSGKEATQKAVAVISDAVAKAAAENPGTSGKCPIKRKRRSTDKKQKKKTKKRRASSSSSSSSDSSSSSSSSSSSDSSSSSSSSDSFSSSSSSSSEEDEDKVREKKIKQAMKKQIEDEKKVDRLMKLDERKRPYNSMCDASKPTDEEMEAFRRRQLHTDDPMAAFLKK